jgi:hypothetical protein
MSSTELPDDEAARSARARQIQERIDEIIEGAPAGPDESDDNPARSPKNPREFTDQKAAEDDTEPD